MLNPMAELSKSLHHHHLPFFFGPLPASPHGFSRIESHPSLYLQCVIGKFLFDDPWGESPVLLPLRVQNSFLDVPPRSPGYALPLTATRQTVGNLVGRI